MDPVWSGWSGAELRDLGRRLYALPLSVEGTTTATLTLRTRSGWRRRTTVVTLHGRGHAGHGEDASFGARAPDFWESPEGRAARAVWLAQGPSANRAARDGTAPNRSVGHGTAAPGTVGEGARRLPPGLSPARRWALESAAASLAAAQAGLDARTLFGRAPARPEVVVSLALGRPPDAARVARVLAAAPEARLKLDLDEPWDAELVERLASTGRVRIVDAKRRGSGAAARPRLGPEAYGRLAARLPGVWIEDPEVAAPGGWDGREVADAIRAAGGRVALDAPLADAAALRAEVARLGPVGVNVKPPRIGGLGALFELYATAAELGLEVHAGGSFELGPGRRRLRLLAGALHPTAPNDAAPPGSFSDPVDLSDPDPDPLENGL